MSKKRTSPETSTDKQTNEDSDSFQEDENAKRAKLTSLSDTMLQDLPMELIELILIKAVAMEVMGMTRKKSLFKEAAESVISRLTTVCSQWNSILTTNYFRNELHRIFDAAKTIRLEIVQKLRFPNSVHDAIAFKDELFVIYKPLYSVTVKRYYIHVYDHKNVAVVKDVIPLASRTQPQVIAACNVSNCLYILNNKPWNLSILRLTKTDEHQYEISLLIYLPKRYDTMAVAANGNLVLGWQRTQEQRALITIYGPDGQLQHETRLTSDKYSFLYKVIPKSNGNFVLVTRNYGNYQWNTKLNEIDMHGTVLRQYQSSLRAWDAVCQADKCGSIAIVRQLNGIELLDSELNLLEYTGLQPDEDQFNYGDRMHYNAERNEVVSLVDRYSVTVFRFTEE